MSRARSIEPLRLPFAARLELPGSKSHAARAIVAACLSPARTHIKGATACEDIALLVKNLQKMGFRLAYTDKPKGILRVDGGLPAAKVSAGVVRLHCGASAFAARVLTALACVVPGVFTLRGTAELSQRPMGPLLEALRALGAEVHSAQSLRSTAAAASPCEATPANSKRAASHGAADTSLCVADTLPLRVCSTGLSGRHVQLCCAKSSQFLSALLLIAPTLREGIAVTLKGTLPSLPYVDLTRELMGHFGVSVRAYGARRFTVAARAAYKTPKLCTIEGDWSAAAAFLVLAELSGSQVSFSNASQHSKQADAVLPKLIEAMRVDGKLELDASNFPDAAMLLATLAAFRKGSTRIGGLGNLRHKECDRFGVLIREFSKLGVKLRASRGDWLVRGPAKLKPATLNPQGDHRMVFCFSVLATLSSGIRILKADCVSKSYPDFFRDLKKLRKQTRPIALVGMRGAGKSVFARRLARQLKLTCVDSDAIFEDAHGGIEAFVQARGWSEFRALEERIVQEHLRAGCVMALGGGAIESPRLRRFLKRKAIVFYLKQDAASLASRLRACPRPPLTDLSFDAELSLIAKRRGRLYQQASDFVLGPQRTTQEAVGLLEGLCSL